MKITRLRVTGGFLSGLDIRFSDGLNVLIGGRGAGKTTVLELIRFALGLEFADSRRIDGQRQYISAVLGTGEISLELMNDGISERIVVDASGEGRRIDLRAPAVMVSQNETEAIASDPDSRLRLIDLRANVSARPLSPNVVDMTVRIQDLQRQIDQAVEQTGRLGELQAERDIAAAHEASLLQKSGDEAVAKNERLRALESGLVEASRLRSRVAYLVEQTVRGDSIAADLSGLVRELNGSMGDIPEALQAQARQVVQTMETSSTRISSSIEKLRTAASEEIRVIEERDKAGRVEAEPLRTALLESEAQLARLTTEVGTLNREVERLRNLSEEINALRSAQETLRSARSELFSTREKSLEHLFDARQAVADAVNGRLGDRVTIALDHLGDTRNFRVFLTAQLKNKGLQYSALVDGILAAYLPLNLLRALEDRDKEAVAEKLSLSSERADRLIEALSDPESLSALATVEAADQVDFRLRDGHELKSVEHLSTGQKCAVTLPILLTDFQRTLLLDQPEDHLDNAYLVTNVVSALNDRTGSGAQTIVATHNANIPVLGNAGMVIALDSDGTRGFVTAMGVVDDLGVVKTISSVMEGGAEAFRKRAAFYALHGLNGD